MKRNLTRSSFLNQMMTWNGVLRRGDHLAKETIPTEMVNWRLPKDSRQLGVALGIASLCVTLQSNAD
jgi:hypothetical protein